jgi:hypothetical protein
MDLGNDLHPTIAVVLAFEALPYRLSKTPALKRLGGYFYVWPAIYCPPTVFVAIFVGAYVARTSFNIPALFLQRLGRHSACTFSIRLPIRLANATWLTLLLCTSYVY